MWDLPAWRQLSSGEGNYCGPNGSDEHGVRRYRTLGGQAASDWAGHRRSGAALDGLAPGRMAETMFRKRYWGIPILTIPAGFSSPTGTQLTRYGWPSGTRAALPGATTARPFISGGCVTVGSSDYAGHALVEGLAQCILAARVTKNSLNQRVTRCGVLLGSRG
jgi:hypothetical protein